jgi:hypothetical protein
VQHALGRPGTVMSSDVFRIGMARTDLKVTVTGVLVRGIQATRRRRGNGDLVLLDQEVQPVMSGLFDNGFEVSGLHNHLNATRSRHTRRQIRA